MNIVLGTASPRRIEIMRYFSLPFIVAPSHFDEASIEYTGDMPAYVQLLARSKNQTLQPRYPHDIIITCDTVVSLDNQPLGKPNDESHMFEMLTKLSGRRHSVFSAITVTSPKGSWEGFEETMVYCNKTTPVEIKQYMTALTLHDKAGSYAIQKAGSLLVNKIDGCYYNVLGLPINLLRTCLLGAGIDLWDYLQDID